VAFFLSLALAGGGLFFGFGLWFAPGWANEWPGLPQKVVWPAGMSILAFVAGAAPIIGFGAYICSRLGGGRQSRWALAVWSGCWLVLMAVACSRLYQALRNEAEHVWP
jgi:hypothetical protein